MNTYPLGQTIDLGPWTLRDSSDALTAASASECTVTLPDGTTATPTVTTSSTGIYSAAYTPALAGAFIYRAVLTLSDGSVAVETGEFHILPAPAATRLEPLVQTVRTLVAVTDTEYTAAGQDWWSDAQITQRLMRNRTYLTGGEIGWTPEPVIGGGGSVSYSRGWFGLPGAVDPYAATGGTAPDWKIMTSAGVVPSGTVTVHGDGQVVFSASQSGAPLFEFYGYTYDVYATAADVLDAWAGHLQSAYDFKTDDQEFDRSQQFQMVSQRAREMRRSAAPRVAQILVPDDNPSVRRTGAMTANQRRTLGL